MTVEFSPGDYDFDKERARSYLLLLTPTERKVLALRCQRKKYKEIAQILFVTQKDVEYHLGNIYTKLKLDFEGLGYNERFYILATFFCPILRDLIGEELKGKIIPWSPTEIIPSPISLVIVTREVNDETTRDDIEVYRPQKTDVIPRKRRGCINIWLYILGTIAVASIGVIIYLLNRPPQPQVIIIETVIVTPPPIVATEFQTEAAQFLPTDTLTHEPVITDTPQPTVTNTSTATTTSTATATQTPTATLSPLELTLGDTWSDNRVSLTTTDVEFNSEYFGASAIWIIFKFSNFSGTDILLRFSADDFSLQDNLGRNYDCWYILRYPYVHSEVNTTVKNGSDYLFTLGCGEDASFDENVNSVVLSVDHFSSLPQMAWTIEVPR